MIRIKILYSTERKGYNVISVIIRNQGRHVSYKPWDKNSAGKEDSLVSLLQKLVGLIWSHIYLKQNLLLVWGKAHTSSTETVYLENLTINNIVEPACYFGKKIKIFCLAFLSLSPVCSQLVIHKQTTLLGSKFFIDGVRK